MIDSKMIELITQTEVVWLLIGWLLICLTGIKIRGSHFWQAIGLIAAALIGYWANKKQMEAAAKAAQLQAQQKPERLPQPMLASATTSGTTSTQVNPNPMAKGYLNWVTQGGQQAIHNANNMLGLLGGQGGTSG